MKANKVKRILAAVLTLCMLLSVAPTMAFAADEPGAGSQEEGLILNKTAQLEDDGTYTIKLEAYATGVVTTEYTETVVKEVKPVDVILILDQSGSMVQNNISGIPTDGYDGASSENAFVNDGDFYYLAPDGKYYKVVAKKVATGDSVMKYVDRNGTVYDQVTNYWIDSGNNRHNTTVLFATSTLTTYTYKRVTTYIDRWAYASDSTGTYYGDYVRQNQRNNARNNLRDHFNNTLYTVVDEQVGSSYYAASYIPVTEQTLQYYRYEYFYKDEDGQEIPIATGNTGLSSEVDALRVPFQMYTRRTKTGTRLEGLQYAANTFINTIRANAQENNVDHRVAVIGYASDDYNSTSSNQYYYANTELFIGAEQYNYAQGGKESTHNGANDLANNHYAQAFQNVNTQAGYDNLTASINALAGFGGTHPDLGFEMANGVFGANDATGRDRIIIFFTDGQPGDTGYDSTVASSTITQVNTAKNTYGATVFTVATLGSTPSTNADTFLKNTSSSGSYTLANQADKLTGFFSEIEKTISTPETNTTASVTLTENAYMLDELSEYFVLPENFSIQNNVTLQVAHHLGNREFAAPTAAPANVVAALNGSNGVKISGFDYISGGDDGNMVRTVDDNGLGNKLIVTIRGVLAVDQAALNKLINTNSENAGIWDKDTNNNDAMIKAFPMPQTRVDKKALILDYAKKTNLDIADLMGIDKATDGIFDKLNDTTMIPGTFGNTVLEGTKLYYTPITMQWDGWDTIYALSKNNDHGDAVTHNIWNKVQIMPANNVYFEDTFVTNEDSGVVGIVFSEGWDKMPEGDNEGHVNDGAHGWIDDMEGEEGYSDGTVAKATAGATATFTFTGTGVDIYSRTNLETGIISVKLYKGTEAKAANCVKFLTVDNLAQNGDYFQIPTAFFSDLEHDTYTVKITVGTTNKVTGTDRFTYYLDGIRVYNPMGVITEGQAGDAYGEEIGATFKSVRDMLIQANDLAEGNTTADGIVYIDYNPNTEVSENTPTIGTYVSYGPKNEVYLTTGHAIAFKVPEGVSVQVAMKAPAGKTSVRVTNGGDTTMFPVDGAADMYYKIIPNADNMIVIKNEGAPVLSITKLKTCAELPTEGEDTDSMAVDINDLMEYVRSFDELAVEYKTWEKENGLVMEEGLLIDKPVKQPITNPVSDPIVEPLKPVVQPESTALVNQMLSGVYKILGR